ALLVNPTNKLVDAERKLAEEAAQALGRELIIVGGGTETEIDAAFEALVQRGAAGLAVWQEAYLNNRRHQITALAQRHKIPTIYANRLATEVGGLMSYGSNPSELYRQVGIYVGKILKGASPGNLPVLQPTTYELVINLKTAKALGLSIPRQ